MTLTLARPDPALEHGAAEDLLRWAVDAFGSRLAIVTSFQADGMVLVDMASRLSPALRVVTLNTGRLPEETLSMIETVRVRYGIAVEMVTPDADEVAAMVRQHGVDLFYESVAQRSLCCQIRKVRPLERKLRDFDAYAVGLRRGQARSRESVAKWEEKDGLLKLSPIADWSREQVDEYTERYSVPRHPLYAKGYQSIGCGPCTRAVQPGEDERAGRWWWEQDAQKECGLHFSPEGKAERLVDVLLRDVLKESSRA